MKKKNIRKILIGLFAISIFLLFTSCSKTIYVPVETIKTEYKDRLQRDSIRFYDSIFVKVDNDTVWLEKYKYVYRDKLLRDSIFINDTIKVPYPVETIKEINKLNGLQNFLVWSGGITILLIIAFFIYRFIKK